MSRTPHRSAPTRGRDPLSGRLLVPASASRTGAPPVRQPLLSGPRSAVRALLSLAVLGALLIGLPALVLDVIGVTHLTGLPALQTDGLSWSSLTARDAGTSATSSLFVLGCLVAGTLCWAAFAIATLTETAAAIRHAPAPRLPLGLSGAQLVIAPLIGAIALLVLPAPHAHAAPQQATPATAITSSTPAPTTAKTSTAAATGHGATGRPAPGAATPTARPTCTVARGDTLWALAQTHLGDPMRWKEIAQLNTGRVQADGLALHDADLLQPGWILQLPQNATAPAHAAPVRTAPVPRHQPAEPTQPAQAAQAAAPAAPAPAAAPAAAAQAPHGPAADQPAATPTAAATGTAQGANTIPVQRPLPGLAAAGPAGAAATPQAGPAPVGAAGPSTAAAVVPPALGQPVAVPSAATVAPLSSVPAGPQPTATGAASDAADHAQKPAERSLAPVPLVGGGAGLLAAGLLAELARRRRAQHRRRRPDRLIRLPGADHARTEMGLRVTADTASAHFLDLGLRSAARLLQQRDPASLPDVVAARLTPNGLVLHLSGTSTAPPPFAADATGTRWTLPGDADLPLDKADAGEVLAPFPTLVTLGHDPEHSDELTLVDLEAVGSIALHGETPAVEGLLCWIAAELAHNAWSEWLTVTVCGFGADLPALNTERITHTDSLAEALERAEQQVQEVSESLAGHGQPTTLAGRVRGIAGDSWVPHVLLVGPATQATIAELEQLTRLAAQPDRASGGPALAVVAGVPLATARWDLELGADGQLELGPVGLQVVAQQLDPALVASLAALMRTALQTTDVDASHAAPASAPASEEPDVDVNDTSPVTPAATLLSFPLAAPVADPALDSDLADFLDPDSRRPHVTVLGPVSLTTPNEQTGQRSPSVTEALVMLALRRRVNEEQMLEGLWPGGAKRTTLTQNLSRARSWLGTDADGQPALPKLDAGSNTYRLNRWVLLDWDLFYRLRTRAATRLEQGDPAAACVDLRAALELVHGPAFDGVPPEKYGWLATSGELHHIPAVVVDAAHSLAELCLAAGDPAAAAWAAGQAQLADGGVEETPWQDRMRAAHAAGDLAEVRDLIAQLKATREVDVEEEFTPDTYTLITRLLPYYYGRRAAGA